jgi:zinc protease
MKHFVAALALCLATLAAHAQLSAVRNIETVAEYALPNGLQILLVPDATKPVATINITYRVGSRHESLGETGSAHLLEHMLFKASGKVANPMQDMQSMGMRWNGTTNFDRTNYFASFLSNDDKAAQRMDYMLSWLAGMMTQAKFTRADLDSEMTVVRNEFERAENEPGRVLGDRMRAAAFAHHGYRHSVLGARSDIENIPLDALYAFYRKHYRPDNATLIIAGRFDEAAVKAKIAAEFGPIPKPASALPASYTEEAVQDGERSVILRRAGGLATTAALYHMPAGGTREGVAARVLAETLTQTSGPLTVALVNQQLAVTEWAYYYPAREPGFMGVGIGLPEKTEGMTDEQYRTKAFSSAAALAKVLEVYQPSDSEVQTARNTLLANTRAILRDAESTGQTLSEMVAQGDWRLLFGVRDTLIDLKGDEVRKLASTYLVASNRTSGTYLPIPANASPQETLAWERTPALPLPSPAQLLAYTPPNPNVLAATATTIGSVTEVIKADSYDITAQSMAQRTQRAQLTVAGSPGLQLAVLPRAAKDDRVHGTLRLRWGTAETVKGSGSMAPMIAALLPEGTLQLNAAQLKDRLQALDARISFSSNAGSLNASLEFPAANTSATLALLNQMLREPAFDQAAFDRNQRAMLASMQNIKADTASLANNTLERSYRPKSLYGEGDPREVRTFEETEALIRQTKLEDLRAYWKRFGAAQVGELVLMGPIALEPVKAQLNYLWGDWASNEKYVPWKLEFATPQGDPSATVPIPDKANASYAGRIAITLSEADADFPALFAAIQILSQQGLRQRVRVKEGLSYGVGAELSMQAVGNTASININASFAPANLAKLRSTIREVLVQARAEGYGAFEVSFAKSAIVSRRAELRNQPANAVGNIANNLRYNRPLDYTQRFDDAYEALDAAAINTALKKYLDPDKLRDAVAGTF